MFNILGFFVQLLEDREQNEFVSDVKKEINNMIDNGFDRFDKGEKIYKKKLVALQKKSYIIFISSLTSFCRK